jgi:hypothetical protein
MGLITELTIDPLARGYAAMTDAQAADSLNTVNRTAARTDIDGNDLLQCTNAAELLALTAAARDLFVGLIQMPKISIANANNRALLGAMFAAGTTTRTNLVALAISTTPVSRAAELGLGVVTAGQVGRARAGVE